MKIGLIDVTMKISDINIIKIQTLDTGDLIVILIHDPPKYSAGWDGNWEAALSIHKTFI